MLNIIFLLLIIFVGGIFTVVSLGILYTNVKKRNFLEVEGIVSEASVVREGSNSGYRYKLSIIVRYTWNDEEYEGSPVLLSYPAKSGVGLHRYLETHYIVDSKVLIYLDEHCPQDFVFDKRIRVRDLIPSLFFLSSAIALVYIYITIDLG